jgi:hypothetical protein
LSLPPRRLAWSELQSGGYSDVTTRGSPERILPIQFALDQEEFLRRFAESELLYFHREEPRQPTTEELVLLLDQGVRTWGDVRLVLTGAALALARQAERKRSTIMLAATGNDGELVDPSAMESRTLAGLLEASDWSPHPGRALANLLQRPAASHRDVVLLTHPRSLGEPEVAAAARSLAVEEGARLFAVSVDSQGQVELAELRRGLPIVLRRCRINFAEAASSASPAVPSTGRPPWKGVIEPIPFPFRCGTLERIDSPQSDGRRHFDFDQAGERVLVVGRYGLLFSWMIDGTDAETLPRPLVDGEVIRPQKTVLGVAGGFVLVNSYQGRQRLAHYDFPSRSCTLHSIDDGQSTATWLYYNDLHTVVGLTPDGTSSGSAVDLAAAGAAAARTRRAMEGATRAERGQLTDPLLVRGTWRSHIDNSRVANDPPLLINPRVGTVCWGGPDGLRSITPESDGRPALKGGRIVCARRGGDVLAVLVEEAAVPGLYFISLSRATVLGTFSLIGEPGASPFALSRDGRRFARLLGDRLLEVRDVPGDRPPVFVTPHDNVWIHFASWGRSCLLVREFDLGGPRRPLSFCLIRWDQGRLDVVHHEAVELFQRLGGVVAESRSLSPGRSGLQYDLHRFVQSIELDRLRVLIDRYNHLAVLGPSGELICMFYVTEDEVAAWMPDGTCWGSRRLIGGDPTPGAAERIAAVLRSAEQGEGASR